MRRGRRLRRACRIALLAVSPPPARPHRAHTVARPMIVIQPDAPRRALVGGPSRYRPPSCAPPTPSTARAQGRGVAIVDAFDDPMPRRLAATAPLRPASCTTANGCSAARRPRGPLPAPDVAWSREISSTSTCSPSCPTAASSWSRPTAPASPTSASRDTAPLPEWPPSHSTVSRSAQETQWTASSTTRGSRRRRLGDGGYDRLPAASPHVTASGDQPSPRRTAPALVGDPWTGEQRLQPLRPNPPGSATRLPAAHHRDVSAVADPATGWHVRQLQGRLDHGGGHQRATRSSPALRLAGNSSLIVRAPTLRSPDALTPWRRYTPRGSGNAGRTGRLRALPGEATSPTRGRDHRPSWTTRRPPGGGA